MRMTTRVAAALMLFAALLAAAGELWAQEAVSLTTPTSATTTTYSVTYVGLDIAANRIVVQGTTNVGTTWIRVYDSTTTPTGATLLHTLNTANFSVNSLVKQIYTRLQTDGVIAAGSITGSPQ